MLVQKHSTEVRRNYCYVINLCETLTMTMIMTLTLTTDVTLKYSSLVTSIDEHVRHILCERVTNVV